MKQTKQIIGYHIDDTGIYCSNGEVQLKPPFLDFLLKPYPGSIKVFSDIDTCVAKLLTLISVTPKELEKLADTNRLWMEPYQLFYLPGKWFSIDYGHYKGHPFDGFSDMSQYESDLSSPNHEPILKAQYTAHVGELVYQAFTDLGFSPNNLISPANVYRKERLDKLSLPNFDCIPSEAMEIAYECVKGNWLEAFSIGHFPEVYDYDMNSAYPYQASLLPDMTGGHWEHTKNYQNSHFGYCRCKVTITSNFSPIIKQYKDHSYSPKGIFETSLTKAEIDFIYRYKLGEVEILDGYWWYPEGQLKPILSGEINDLYKKKNNATGIKKDIVKRIMAGSFYGIFIELRQDQFGDHFFAPYAAEIESRTRIKLASVCLENHITPLHIAVDGLITDKPLDMGCALQFMGGWRLEQEAKQAIICSSGLVAIEGKQGKGDFSIGYDWLKNQIESNPEATEYTLKKEEILTLAHANNLGKPTDVGKLQTINRTINFADHKRDYPNLPQNFGELLLGIYSSEPWDAGMIEILENF